MNNVLNITVVILYIHQNILHAVSYWTNSMLGVDPTSGSLLYSRNFPSLKPFAITVYDADSPNSFNGKC